MHIINQKTIKVDELASLVPTKSGATFAQLWQIFHYTRMFKYMNHSHYGLIKPAYKKICTQKNLLKLCSLGYFKSPALDIYCATNKVLPILKQTELNTEILPNEPTGLGDINEINNTDVFVQATKLPHFNSLLFPHFQFLIPDALLVQIDVNTQKYKLTFLEIEAHKPKWVQYIHDKKENYIKLASTNQFYEYWSTTAPKLHLPVPKIEDLGFTVAIISSLKNQNFGNGFKMVSQILDLA